MIFHGIMPYAKSILFGGVVFWAKRGLNHRNPMCFGGFIF